MPIDRLNQILSKRVMVSKINRRKGEKRCFRFAKVRQRLGKFGLWVFVGGQDLRLGEARRRDGKRRASGFDRNVIFLPFSLEKFPNQNKARSKLLLNPTQTNKQTINNGRVRIFPNLDVLKAST